MKTLLRPYEGTLPYLFVSYAHKNDAAVLEIISTLQSRGFRVWYDEGIEAGSEWPESIASHLERAQLVLAFLSPAYLRSDNCRKEMHYALTKRKPVINVYLEPTELSPGMEMQIGNLFALMKYTYPSEEYFYDKLFSAELLGCGQIRRRAAGAAARGARRAAAGKKGQREKAARRKAPPGKTSQSAKARAAEEKAPRPRGGDHRRRARRLPDRGRHRRPLHGPALPLHGQDRRGADARGRHGRPVPEPAARAGRARLCRQARGRAHGRGPQGPHGAVRLRRPVLVRRPAAGRGRGGCRRRDGGDDRPLRPDRHRAARRHPRLVRPRVFSEPDGGLGAVSVADLAREPAACGVEVFDVSANRLTSLSGIEQLPKLTALTADGNAVTDLTGLGRCLNVRKLSLNGANVSDLSELRALTKLQDVTLSHCTRRELLIVLHKSSLTHLTLVGCDLRGDFFRSFDRERALTALLLTDCELDSTSGLEDFTGLTELTVRGVSGTLDWSALGGLPLQTVTADALQADAIAAATTVAVTVVD